MQPRPRDEVLVGSRPVDPLAAAYTAVSAKPSEVVLLAAPLRCIGVALRVAPFNCGDGSELVGATSRGGPRYEYIVPVLAVGRLGTETSGRDPARPESRLVGPSCSPSRSWHPSISITRGTMITAKGLDETEAFSLLGGSGSVSLPLTETAPAGTRHSAPGRDLHGVNYADLTQQPNPRNRRKLTHVASF